METARINKSELIEIYKQVSIDATDWANPKLKTNFEQVVDYTEKNPEFHWAPDELDERVDDLIDVFIDDDDGGYNPKAIRIKNDIKPTKPTGTRTGYGYTRKLPEQSRIQVCTEIVLKLDQGDTISREALAAKTDAVYVRKGGKTNKPESSRHAKHAAHVLQSLGLIDFISATELRRTGANVC